MNQAQNIYDEIMQIPDRPHRSDPSWDLWLIAQTIELNAKACGPKCAAAVRGKE